MNVRKTKLIIPIFVFSFFVFSWLTVLGLASSPSLAQTPKVCLVNFQRALNEVSEGKKAKEDLKKDFERKQKDLEGKQNQLKKLQEELQAKSAALSQSALRQKEQEYRQKFLDLQKSLGQARQELASKEAKLTQEIILKLKQISQDIGKSKGCDLVVESSQETILYAKDSKDLTDEVIKKHNSKR